MKPWSRLCIISSVALAAMTMSGCGGGRSQWKISVENKGTTPCSVYVTMDSAGGGAQSSGRAQVEAVAAGERLTLIVGDFVQTVRSVKVVRGEDEQVLQPNTELRPGNHYLITVSPEGKVQAAFEQEK